MQVLNRRMSWRKKIYENLLDGISAHWNANSVFVTSNIEKSLKILKFKIGQKGEDGVKTFDAKEKKERKTQTFDENANKRKFEKIYIIYLTD